MYSGELVVTQIPTGSHVYLARCGTRFTSNCSNKGPEEKIFVSVDGVGIELTRDRGLDASIESLRSLLIGVREEVVSFVAESPEDFLEKFFSMAGTMVGGSALDRRAVWLLSEHPILELPHCKHFAGVSQDGSYYCGTEPDFWLSGFAGGDGCGADGDPSWHCAINDFLKRAPKAVRFRLASREGVEFRFVGGKEIG